MKNKDPKVLRITQGAIIAALYVVLTMVFAPISFGPVQVRIAEALCILPMFTPAAIPGLFIGCVIANLIGGGIMLDVIFGSLATLIGAVLGYMLRKNRWLVPLPAVIANALIVPFVLKYGYGVVDVAIPVLMFQILLGEIAGCYVLGELLCTALLKNKNRIFSTTAENN
jgi:uncharacterized membrane protein